MSRRIDTYLKEFPAFIFPAPIVITGYGFPTSGVDE
jgi:hypothetical protein